MSPAAASPSILRRFPSHLGAEAPGKLVGAVVDALAGELEAATNDLARVRRSRRLAEATELADLLRLAALHAIEGHALELLRRRLAAAAAIGAIAADADVGDAELARAFDGLPAAVALPADAYLTDNRSARPLLVSAIATTTAYAAMLALLRARIETVIALHRRGNGTVKALLGASANALDLDVVDVSHSYDRYWHVAHCRDRLRLGTRPAIASRHELAPVELTPLTDDVVLEENPGAERVFGPLPMAHGDRQVVSRRGYEAAPVSIRVVAVGARTVAPMVVSVDTGVGLAYTGALHDGETLVYSNDGRRITASVVSTAAGATTATSVDADCYSFAGGVFADDGWLDSDFVFADEGGDAPGRVNVATWAKSNPPDAFERDHPLSARDPKGDLPAVLLPAGSARWALFVGAGTFAGEDERGGAVVTSPLLFAARFDDDDKKPRSVWDPDPAPVAALGLSWHEHEAFRAVLWIPARFAALDDPKGQPDVADRVAKLVERHRAAGVEIDVRLADADPALAERRREAGV